MRTHLPRLALVAALALALTGCASAKGPTWTYAPAADSPAVGAAAPASAAPAAAAPAASMAPMGGQAIEIDAFDLGFKPAAITVAAPGMYDVTFKNTGSTAHDVTFSDGTKIAADGGQTTTGMVTVPAGGLTFLCSIPGHAAAGMTGAVTVSGAAPAASSAPVAAAPAGAPVADPNAPKYTLFDPAAPKVMPGTRP